MSSLKPLFSIRNASLLCFRPISASPFTGTHVARAISCGVACRLNQFSPSGRSVYAVPIRGFRSSLFYSFAKKKKGGKGKGGPSNDDSGVDAPAPPDMKDVEAQMDKRIAHLKEELSKMHNSRVNKDMFNNVMVEAYGSKSAIPECGQVSVQTASKVVINVFDAGIVPAVTKALRDCGLNLNPIVDGSMVSVPVPKASKEKREDMMKLAKKTGEKTKQEVRHIRKVMMDRVKELKNSISEDEVRKATKDVDAVTEKKVKAVDAEVKAKEKDIMS